MKSVKAAVHLLVHSAPGIAGLPLLSSLLPTSSIHLFDDASVSPTFFDSDASSGDTPGRADSTPSCSTATLAPPRRSAMVASCLASAGLLDATLPRITLHCSPYLERTVHAALLNCCSSAVIGSARRTSPAMRSDAR